MDLVEWLALCAYIVWGISALGVAVFLAAVAWGLFLDAIEAAMNSRFAAYVPQSIAALNHSDEWPYL